MSTRPQSVYLGEYVETTSFGQRGRVTETHHRGLGCPEGAAWLAGQTGLGDNPSQFDEAPWVSILVHKGGAVLVPNLPEFVKVVEPFDFENPWADCYWREYAS